VRTLRRATVHCLLEGPPPVDPDRWLEWRARRDDPMPLAVGRFPDGTHYLPCFTRPRPPGIWQGNMIWAFAMPFTDVVGQAVRLGVDQIVIDPGKDPSISVGARSYDEFTRPLPEDEPGHNDNLANPL